jgi:hypothetical protein
MIRLASLVICVALAAAPAHASATDDLAVEALHNFGKCVVQVTPKGAKEVLAMDFRTEDYQERLRRLARGHGRCTRPRTELRFNGVLLAGAMAEELLESGRSFARLSELIAAKPAQLIVARTETEMMALCTVRTAPANVAELLKQPIATDEEQAAVKALTPSLTACLAKGQKLEANRPAIRSLLALAAWRIASSSQQANS